LWNAAALGCGAPVFAMSQQLVADFQLIFNYQITQLPNGGLSLYPYSVRSQTNLKFTQRVEINHCQPLQPANQLNQQYAINIEPGCRPRCRNGSTAED
jgi:hypothetical protein